MKDVLTICIPTRNRPDYLAHAIMSVVEKFGENTPIIIGDNGDDHDQTKTILASFTRPTSELNITHLCNSKGGSYVENLQGLVDSVSTPWLSILHDDDFFTQPPPHNLASLLTCGQISFVFSDHWVARADGSIDLEKSTVNSTLYGRAAMETGNVWDLCNKVINQTTCLDGFFIETKIAKSIRFDSSYKVFGDVKWIIEVADFANGRGYYLGEKLFAYRLSPDSITSKTLDHIELFRSLKSIKLKNKLNQKALFYRMAKQWKFAAKQALKKRRLREFVTAHLT